MTEYGAYQTNFLFNQLACEVNSSRQQLLVMSESKTFLTPNSWHFQLDIFLQLSRKCRAVCCCFLQRHPGVPGKTVLSVFQLAKHVKDQSIVELLDGLWSTWMGGPWQMKLVQSAEDLRWRLVDTVHCLIFGLS